MNPSDDVDIHVANDKFGIWVVPPLMVTAEEIDWLVAAIDDALTKADEWLSIG